MTHITCAGWPQVAGRSRACEDRQMDGSMGAVFSLGMQIESGAGSPTLNTSTVNC